MCAFCLKESVKCIANGRLNQWASDLAPGRPQTLGYQSNGRVRQLAKLTLPKPTWNAVIRLSRRT